MTVVVAFFCTDGVVVAADSMLTPSFGSLSVGHHKTLKIELLTGPQLFAYAGHQGQGARFKFIAEASLTGDLIDVATVLAFLYKRRRNVVYLKGHSSRACSISQHYYVALGGGKQLADPFLRFLVDTFCQHGQPNVADARFLATWALGHVIDTNPGGVAGPIRMAVIETGPDRECKVWRVTDEDLGQHEQAIESATDALRRWLEGFRSTTVRDAPDLPASPTKS